MTVLVAKPYINNNNELKEFTNVKEAVKYLNSFLPNDYPIMDMTDFAMIGKLFNKDGSDLIPKGSIERFK